MFELAPLLTYITVVIGLFLIYLDVRAFLARPGAIRHPSGDGGQCDWRADRSGAQDHAVDPPAGPYCAGAPGSRLKTGAADTATHGGADAA